VQFYGAPIGEYCEHYGRFKVDLDEKFEVDYVPTDEVLEMFPYLAPRLVNLLEKMEHWSPQTFRELTIPGYADRLSWWGALFAFFFGLISIFVLAVSIYSAILIQLQLNLMRNQS
jgi:hypothetical protein